MSKYVLVVNLIFIECSNELTSKKFNSIAHFSSLKDILIPNLSIFFRESFSNDSKLMTVATKNDF